jgi:rod shape-determining protein MreD
MTRFLFIVTLFVLFIMEGTVVQVFATDRWGMGITMIPRFVIVMLIISALFLGHIQGLMLGVIFGLAYDIVYGSIIGVYAFSMGLVGYFSGLTFRIFHQNIFLILSTVLIVLTFHEMVVYGILSLINFVDMDFHFFAINKVIPTLVMNMIFALVVTYPLRSLLMQLQEEEEN